MARFLAFLLLAPTAMACGDPDCPDDTTYDGYRCVPNDAGADTDAGTPMGDAGPDAGVDASVTDSGTSDSGAVDAGGCVPAEETCNGVDDDCDGDVDEGLALTPVGGPVSVTTGGTGQEEVVLLAIDDGYFAVWDNSDRDVVYAWLNDSGGITDGPSTVDAAATPFQTTPSAAIVGESAVVVWAENSIVRGRAIPLDGTSPPAPIEIADETGYTIIGTAAAVVTGGLVVGWRRSNVGIVTTTYNGALETQIEPPDIAYAFETTPGSTFAPVLMGSSTDSEFLLLGFIDQRSGDTGPRPYVGRLSSTGLAEGVWVALGPVLQSPNVAGAAVASGPTGFTAAIVSMSRAAPGGTRRVDLHRLQPRSFGDTLDSDSIPLASGRFYANAAVTGDGVVIDVAWAEVAGASAAVQHATISSGGSVTGPDSIGTTVGPDVDVARLPAARGAVIYTDGAPGERDVVFQPLGCE